MDEYHNARCFVLLATVRTEPKINCRVTGNFYLLTLPGISAPSYFWPQIALEPLIKHSSPALRQPGCGDFLTMFELPTPAAQSHPGRIAGTFGEGHEWAADQKTW